ncbi:hypothetical protein FA13DRAFT_1526410 [Coprinellus micaceus]|uniref:Uncharacterized protein n=1 Tax=Coprinellus micaceus TaxID=71717 RepID=A0A4Y7SJF9_COPMI|nr:hypothetical protein FA13DRAFT_1526410 [Coprinellus micaceus]
MLWLNYLVSNTFPDKPTDRVQPANPTRVCKILLELTREDEALERHITASPAVVDYCMAAWAAMNHRSKEAFYQFSASGCSITQLLFALLSNTESAERIFYLLSLPGKKGKMVRDGMLYGAAFRCSQAILLTPEEVEQRLQEETSEPQGPAFEALLDHLEILLEIARTLWKNAEVAIAFLKSPFLYDLVAGLKMWLLTKSDRKRDSKARYNAFKFLAKISISLGNVPSMHGPGYWKLCAAAWRHVFQVIFPSWSTGCAPFQRPTKSTTISSRSVWTDFNSIAGSTLGSPHKQPQSWRLCWGRNIGASIPSRIQGGKRPIGGPHL